LQEEALMIAMRCCNTLQHTVLQEEALMSKNILIFALYQVLYRLGTARRSAHDLCSLLQHIATHCNYEFQVDKGLDKEQK